MIGQDLNEHRPFLTMPNLLTIPTEIRLKILDYAISDVTVQELTPARYSARWVLHTCWVLQRFNNPNLPIGNVCRQIRNESRSQRVSKPTLTIHGSWCQSHSQYCVLKDVSIVGRMAQFSVLKFEDVMARDSLWSVSEWSVSDMVKNAMERHLDWYECNIEVEKPKPEDADQREESFTVSVVAKSH